jgi:lysophospholipase L1-like esterase
MSEPPLFARYIALGDSMSIDLYPALDQAGMNGCHEMSDLRGGLGAASLLFSNANEMWPEFAGRDLATLMPECAFRNHHAFSAPARYPTDNLTADGATTGDVLGMQLMKIEPSDQPVLVTLTAGGNDMLQVLHSDRPPPSLVTGIVERLQLVLRQLRAKLPHALIVVATVYDPSDGTNDLGGGSLDVQAGWLRDFNRAVRELAAETPGVRLADVHAHFLGNGISIPMENRWYWRGLIFEPNARGASEIRRLWLNAIER